MSSELLIVIAGVVLSLLFSYIPGLKDWYDPLAPNAKRVIMLGALVLSAGGVFALACFGKYDLVACDAAGAWNLLEYFVLAAIANQTAYQLSPQ